MKYEIGITEELHKTIEVEAISKEDALRKVEDMYNNEEIVLSADDFSNTYIDFEENEIDYEKNIRKEITNYFDVDQSVYDFARKYTNEVGYNLLEVLRMSNHEDDKNLFVVMAYNKDALTGYKYVSWIMNNRGLDSGKYSNSFKQCMSDTVDRLYDYKEINEYEKDQNIEDDFEDLGV